MQIKRFIAPDMRTALRMIRDAQGPDAVILSNRAIAGGIEVVAAADYDETLVTQALRAAAPGLELARDQEAGTPAGAPEPTRFEVMMAALSSKPDAGTLTGPNRVAATEPPAMPPAPAPAPVAVAVAVVAEPDPAIVAMREDMASMRQLIERQMEQLSLERLRGSPAREAAYNALVGFGCDQVLAQSVAEKIDPRLEPAQIRGPMLAELARRLACARSESLEMGGVIALVGPTGAGKTTTAAKLAARYAARHSARDVVLITTDCERAGAHEQLHAYGRRLGITVREAAGRDGLQNALSELSDYPLVLVDTTGYAPRDRALFGQILWLRAAHQVRSLLVLPANGHPHDLDVMIRRYHPARPEGVILTKLDETGCLGSALSVVARHGLTLTYTTHGQQVPSDIEIAAAEGLAQTLEKNPRAADNTLAIEDHHALA